MDTEREKLRTDTPRAELGWSRQLNCIGKEVIVSLPRSALAWLRKCLRSAKTSSGVRERKARPYAIRRSWLALAFEDNLHKESKICIASRLFSKSLQPVADMPIEPTRKMARSAMEIAGGRSQSSGQLESVVFSRRRVAAPRNVRLSAAFGFCGTFSSLRQI